MNVVNYITNMKEINAIVDAWKTVDPAATKAAIATVVRVEGSSYRRTGARMLVLDDGTYLGGISGGCLEGDALRRAQKAIALDKSSLITYDTSQNDGHEIGVGLGCNGIIDVLFTPLQTYANSQHQLAFLERVRNTREPRVLITITKSDQIPEALGAMYLYEDENTFLPPFISDAVKPVLLKDIKKTLEAGSSETVDYEDEINRIRIFIEIISPAIHLIIYGSNHDIYAMAKTAKEVGWLVTLVTNTSKAGKNLFQVADHVLNNKLQEQPIIDAFTAIILMAHDYNTDYNNLQSLIHSRAPYLGLLGPRKRSEKMFRTLEEEGRPLSAEQMSRIYSPAGLDIGAATPEEIAISIIAEIKSSFAGREGMSLRLRQGTIYGN